MSCMCAKHTFGKSHDRRRLTITNHLVYSALNLVILVTQPATRIDQEIFNFWDYMRISLFYAKDLQL